jgi:glycosyltransferase involved in cell wall biosynthesis
LKPKITIITPSLNQAQYIEQTLDSVLSQGYGNLEYIVIDGGSTDGSVEIIKRYSNHLSYFVSEKDSGQSNAINKGLAVATGDVVNWINSDDFYAPRALNLIGDIFQDDNVKVVCGRSNIVKGQEIQKQSRGTDVYDGNLAKTIAWARIDQPETFFRRSAFQTIGPLNERFHFVMDKEFWIRYLLYFGLDGIRRTDEILANFRLHPNSKTESQKAKFQIETARLFYYLCNQVFPDRAAMIKKILLEGVEISELDIQLNGKNISEDVVSYYFLLSADQSYYERNLRKARTLLSEVNVDLLAPPDRALLRKLMLRSRFLPEWLLKIRKA